jgi:hypothetical protein
MADTDFERLNIILAARDREFARAMDRNTRRIARFEQQSTRRLHSASKGFDVLGLAARRLVPILAGLASINAVQRVVSDLDNIGKTADRLGLTTDALQELRAAAESAGVSTNTFDMAIQRFGRRIAEARQGTGEAKGVIEEMGIALVAADGTARSIEAVLGDVADNMAGMAEQTDRNRIAMKLFDSEGVALVNLLREGSAGMAQMRADARELGIVLDEELIREAEAARTQLDLLSKVIKAQLSRVLVELAPLIVGAADGIARFARMVGDAADAISDFLEPQDDLADATDALVESLEAEMKATAALSDEIGTGIEVTRDMAGQKVEQARAHYASARAAMADARAIVFMSQAYQGLVGRIAAAREAIDTMAAPGRGDEAAPGRGDAFEAAQRRLAELLKQQSAMLKPDQQLLDWISQAEQNLADLEGSVEAAEGDVVRLGPAANDAGEGFRNFGAGIAGTRDALLEAALGLEQVTEKTAGVGGSARIASEAVARLGDEATEADRRFEQLGSSIESSMENAFMGMVDGTKTVGQAFAAMASEIIKELFRVLVVQRMVGSFSGGTGLAGGLGNLLGPLFGRAAGGMIQPDRPYTVGEHGREVIVPKAPGVVLSAAKTKQAASGGGRAPVVVNQTIEITTGIQQTVRAEIMSLMPQIQQASKAAVVEARRRGQHADVF